MKIANLLVSDKNVSNSRDYQLCFLDDDVFDETTETKIARNNEVAFGASDQGTSEISLFSDISSGDQYAVGPTVHCHHADESASDDEEVYHEEKDHL